ncbi:CAP domain-containing protein [Rhodococcus sp. BH5]|uniref:CAP domain-containing protein n=1 Tax=Rhodococcus sp. BH5 TaxID=2871702 RepID=UPI0022CDA499|nr:CAP domain-containing protein [Rhodococcus sp. BH5]MCZ9635342.1 CAP domain-containing protein [Rhodococcus sp. BH5]
MRTFMRSTLAAVATTLAFTAPIAVVVGTASAAPAPHLSIGSAISMPQEITAATNARRAAYGMRSLAVDAALTATAQGWSSAMATLGVLEHNPVYTATYRPGWTWSAENIYKGNSSRTAASIVDSWMNSPEHRANILNPRLTHIGVGYATGPAGTYSTQNFAAY